MPRRSLRPHLNQIRTWVRQGRTDAWVAHQLEVSVRDIDQFKRQNELISDDESPESAPAADFTDEIDLRAEDDALIAAELEAAELEAEREKAEAEAAAAAGKNGRTDSDADSEEDEDEAGSRTRRRSRRGGRGRRGSAAQARSGPLEGTFDHGEEGYGLWLDPAVQDNPIYAEHWAGHRSVEVTVEEDQILIRRVGEDE